MPKKNKGKKKKPDEEKRAIIYADLDGQVYGIVEKALGSRYFDVKCLDNKMRRCRIRKKRIKIKLNDVVIVSLRDFDDKNGDIIYKYDLDETRILQKEGILPSSSFTFVNNNMDDDIEVGFDFESI